MECSLCRDECENVSHVGIRAERRQMMGTHCISGVWRSF